MADTICTGEARGKGKRSPRRQAAGRKIARKRQGGAALLHVHAKPFRARLLFVRLGALGRARQQRSQLVLQITLLRRCVPHDVCCTLAALALSQSSLGVERSHHVEVGLHA
jgi:hypothetical protein